MLTRARPAVDPVSIWCTFVWNCRHVWTLQLDVIPRGHRNQGRIQKPDPGPPHTWEKRALG